MVAGEGASAVIGKSVQIRGEVKGSEDLVVEGQVEGTITMTESRLTIGQNANITANVSARDVILLGRLHGNIQATGRVELRQGCDLVGDIATGRLSIEENALFRGKVDLTETTGKATATPPGKASVPEAPLLRPAAQK
jgi:cytoskeletal protein CcmA (bactofilin family)